MCVFLRKNETLLGKYETLSRENEKKRDTFGKIEKLSLGCLAELLSLERPRPGYSLLGGRFGDSLLRDRFRYF